MWLKLMLCSCCALVSGVIRQLELTAYSPPSDDEIVDKYFPKHEVLIQHQDSKPNVTDAKNFLGVVQVIRNSSNQNTNLGREMYANDGVKVGTKANDSTVVTNTVWNRVFKSIPPNPIETTTYQYPTATWTAENYRRFKKNQRSKPVLKKLDLSVRSPFISKQVEGKEISLKRGRIKYQDSPAVNSLQIEARTDPEILDEFLRESLQRYLTSSNLKQTLGNVSVKMFSEILKNVTRQKTLKQYSKNLSPYDENKALRIRFRNGILSKRKTETRVHAGILEKQLQRRLEKMHEYKKVETNTELISTTNEMNETNATQATIESRSARKNVTGSSKQNHIRGELTLTAAETVYYRKRHYPVQSTVFKSDIPGVIPGVPEVDYPMYSVPPTTGFKCPEGKAGRPRMMADTKTRCQVFYICSNDGPAAAMLCPNGTMFNENVLVCDWWYNVDC